METMAGAESFATG